jgi:hypothetical protein
VVRHTPRNTQHETRSEVKTMEELKSKLTGLDERIREIQVRL